MKALNLRVDYRRLCERFADMIVLQLKIFFRRWFAELEEPETGINGFPYHDFTFPEDEIQFGQLIVRQGREIQRHYFRISSDGADFRLLDVTLDETVLNCFELEFYGLNSREPELFLAITQGAAKLCYPMGAIPRLMLWDSNLKLSCVVLETDNFITIEGPFIAVDSVAPKKRKGELFEREVHFPIIPPEFWLNIDPETSYMSNESCFPQSFQLGIVPIQFLTTLTDPIPGVEGVLERFEETYASYAALELEERLVDEFLVVSRCPIGATETFLDFDLENIEFIYNNYNQNHLLTVYCEKTATMYDQQTLQQEIVYHVRSERRSYELRFIMKDIYSALALMRPFIKLSNGWTLWIADFPYAQHCRIKLDLVKQALCREEMRIQQDSVRTFKKTLDCEEFPILFESYKANAARRLLSLKKEFESVENAEREHEILILRLETAREENVRLIRECARIREKMNTTEAERIVELRKRRLKVEKGSSGPMSIMDPHRTEIEDTNRERQFDLLKQDNRLKGAMQQHLKEQKDEEFRENLRRMRDNSNRSADDMATRKERVQDELYQLQRRCEAVERAKNEKNSKKDESLPVSFSLPGLKTAILAVK